MNRILPAFIVMISIASCKTSKDYLAHRNEDKTLYSIIKQLNKKPGDQLAVAALPEVYAQLQQTHLDNISHYAAGTEPSRWEKIGNEYNILQDMYYTVINSSAASNLVTAVSYQKQIDSTKQQAAEDYYSVAMEYYNNNNWEDYRRAYQAFKRADAWLSNYKGSVAMMDSARRKGVVTIVINPVQDNSFFFNSGWNNNDIGFTPANFSQGLVTELGGKSSGRYPAKFYTDWLAQRDNVTADWTVDLLLKNTDIPSPGVYNYTRNVSASVENGRDSAGKAIYKTVYAVLHIQRRSFNARAEMDINVTDIASQKNILFNTVSDTYNWQQEVASYTGDSRALSNRDWDLVNNRYYQPAKEEVLGQLYRGLYPQVKNRLINIVSW